jgi:hypothetical protein
MKMKKISKSRWAILAFVLACLVVLFSTSGCSMLTDKMNQVKCGMTTCEIETPVVTEDIRG